jgi:hypothetical protein
MNDTIAIAYFVEPQYGYSRPVVGRGIVENIYMPINHVMGSVGGIYPHRASESFTLLTSWLGFGYTENE